MFLWGFLTTKRSVIFLIFVTVLIVGCLLPLIFRSISGFFVSELKQRMFPLRGSSRVIFLSLFIILARLNASSLIFYSFPVSTVISFNLRVAISCWVRGLLIQFIKIINSSFVLPANSPWYLVPFLSLVELVRVLVRPLTLSFRLLANMTAGHILITLITKVSLWEVGVLLAGLELMVSLVQAFVFSILIRVYIEEAFRH